MTNFDSEIYTELDALELPNLLIEASLEAEDILSLAHLPDSPVSKNSSIVNSNNNSFIEQYEILINYEEIIHLELLEENLVYTSELG